MRRPSDDMATSWHRKSSLFAPSILWPTCTHLVLDCCQRKTRTRPGLGFRPSRKGSPTAQKRFTIPRNFHSRTTNRSSDLPEPPRKSVTSRPIRSTCRYPIVLLHFAGQTVPAEVLSGCRTRIRCFFLRTSPRGGAQVPRFLTNMSSSRRQIPGPDDVIAH